MSLEYAWEKLSLAVTNLATSTASIQERLADVYLSHIYVIGLDVKADLPPDLQDTYCTIEQALTRMPAQGNEGTVVATTRVMNEAEATELIKQIVALYEEVTQRLAVIDHQADHKEGSPSIPRYNLGAYTLVCDVEDQQALMQLNGVVVLPVGARIELVISDKDAQVVGVRLLRPSYGSSNLDEQAAYVCLDVVIEL